MANFLDDSQQMWLDSVNKFMDNEITCEYIRKCDQNRDYPYEAYEKIAQQGWLGLLFSEEEGGAGGKAMVADGLMQRFGIDEVYGMHNYPGLPAGQFATRTGPIMAAAAIAAPCARCCATPAWKAPPNAISTSRSRGWRKNTSPSCVNPTTTRAPSCCLMTALPIWPTAHRAAWTS